jgi:hypothetical protein
MDQDWIDRATGRDDRPRREYPTRGEYRRAPPPLDDRRAPPRDYEVEERPIQ